MVNDHSIGASNPRQERAAEPHPTEHLELSIEVPH